MEPVLSIHPYFRINDGQREAFLALLPEFVSRTATEEGCQYYEFFADSDLVYCREAYRDGDAFLTHLENVGDLLGKALELSTVERLEVHGPSAEVEKVKPPLADLNPQCFTYHCGVPRG